MTRLLNEIGLRMIMIRVDEMTKEWVVEPDEDRDTWHLREVLHEACLCECGFLRAERQGDAHV